MFGPSRAPLDCWAISEKISLPRSVRVTLTSPAPSRTPAGEYPRHEGYALAKPRQERKFSRGRADEIMIAVEVRSVIRPRIASLNSPRVIAQIIDLRPADSVNRTARRLGESGAVKVMIGGARGRPLLSAFQREIFAAAARNDI